MINDNVVKHLSTHQTQQLALGVCLAANVNPLVWGNPGVGKSQTFKHIAEANNMYLEMVLASTVEPPQLNGYPTPRESFMDNLPPYWAYNIDQIYRSQGTIGMIFFDEISTAPPANQAASLTILLDKIVGRLHLPEQTRMTAAANPPEIAANGWELSPPMANRFVHLDWSIDAETVAQGFQLGWEAPSIPLLPKEDKLKIINQNVRMMMGSFVRKNPRALEYDNDAIERLRDAPFKASNYAYSTPRSLDFATKLYSISSSAIDRKTRKPLHENVSKMVLEGAIGVAQTKKFLTHIKSFKLMNPVDVLKNPKSFEMPRDIDITSTLLASVQITVLNHINAEVFPQLWINWGDILVRFVEEGKIDLAYSFIKTWYSNRPANVLPTETQLKSFEEIFSLMGIKING